MIIPVPNVLFMPLEEAKKRLYEYKLDITYKKSNKALPNHVLSYTLDEEALHLEVALPPEGSFSHDEAIAYVYKNGFVTGRNSINKDVLVPFGAGATDLGINVKLDEDRFVHLYGDTFSGKDVNDGYWNSNFMAVSRKQDLDNGLKLDKAIITENGFVKPIIQGQHDRNLEINQDLSLNKEVSKIPTGGIVVNNYLYVYVMCVHYWGVDGEWLIRKNILLKCPVSDLGNWSEVKGVSFPLTTSDRFGQIYPFENEFDPKHIYFLSIRGGRSGPLSLLRVKKDSIEDKSKYQLCVSKNKWVSLDKGLKMEPYYLLDKNASEPSIMYNHYLKKWISISIDEGNLVMHMSSSLTKKFDKTVKILDHNDVKSFYGCLLCKDFTKYNDQKMYVQISQWSPVYNTSLLEIVLK